MHYAPAGVVINSYEFYTGSTVYTHLWQAGSSLIHVVMNFILVLVIPGVHNEKR